MLQATFLRSIELLGIEVAPRVPHGTPQAMAADPDPRLTEEAARLRLAVGRLQRRSALSCPLSKHCWRTHCRRGDGQVGSLSRIRARYIWAFVGGSGRGSAASAAQAWTR
jgi:hypothetical protein